MSLDNTPHPSVKHCADTITLVARTQQPRSTFTLMMSVSYGTRSRISALPSGDQPECPTG